MKNRLEVPCYLTYVGSRDYTTKSGDKKTLYKFNDQRGNEIENVLPEPLTCAVGTICQCVLQCGKRWDDENKRYNAYYRVTSATPTKPKEKEKEKN